MESLKHTFKNNGLGEYNDDPLNRLFELSPEGYTFRINPSGKTKFWRFGIRLSKTENIEFYHPSGRYTRPGFDKFIDIHLGVGEWNRKEWYLPNRFNLAQYNLFEDPLKHILFRFDSYKEFSQVEWTIKQGSLNVSLRIENTELFTNSYPLDGEYKFFKVFAWADGTEFEIDCTINIHGLNKTRNKKKFIEAGSPFCITDNLSPAIKVEELAQAIGEVLKKFRDEKGNMFGIFGQWGRGKTFLWNEIWKYISKPVQENKVQFLKVEFHAWKYQDTPASWAYLYETLADKYFQENETQLYKTDFEQTQAYPHPLSLVFNCITRKKRVFPTQNTTDQEKEAIHPFGLLFIYLKDKLKETAAILTRKTHKIIKTIKLNSERKGLKPVIYFSSGLLIFLIWLFLVPLTRKAEWGIYLISSVGIIGIIKIVYLYFSYKAKALNILSMYSEKVSFQKYLGMQAEIQKEIVFLLKSWIAKDDISRKKIVLFVDDIDRCDEDRIIQVVDSLKVMLEDDEIAKRIIILVALDERVLKRAITKKYKKLNDGSPEMDDFVKGLTKEYIDKLFLSGLKLGHLSSDEKDEIFDSVVEGRIDPRIDQTIDSDIPVIIDPTIKDSPSETTEPPLIKEEEYIVKGNKDYDIDQIEYRYLKEILPFYRDPTPRAIRIYYYRYMLAKNIMNYSFTEGSLLYNLWHNRDNKSILPALIVHYSNTNNSRQIQDDCKKEIEKNESKVYLSILNQSYEVELSLYLALLKIVEMVVPY